MKKWRRATLASVLAITGSAAVAAEEWKSQADPAAITVSGQARFTVLTPALLRLEWSPSSTFEDRASLTFVNRLLPVPKFTKESADGWLVIRTDELTLRYKEGSGEFKPDNLSIEFKSGDRVQTWRPGLKNEGNLRGTARTLDGVSGSCPLEPGLLSRDGWSLVDDSPRPLFTDDKPAWVTGRPAARHQDWYFFGYGRDYTRLLGDYTKVAGRIPLPPKFAFGVWWSRYWAYTADELKQLVQDFEANQVPLDVMVVDMDWHKEGWTGYTWDLKNFPDPQGFLEWMHERGLRVTLNLHPHEGVRAHEQIFPEFAKRMGVDAKSTQQIPFDCADPKYMDLYFKLLHHPLEKQGVDFWWIDWQQGAKTQVEGLDPLFWLNHRHWMDMLENPERAGQRPLIFSRWGDLGSHRYQIGFSGDTFCNWASLAFQPYFTATASNVAFAYWSHDIGGHQPGLVAPELYARWIQFGAVSPALRTHTTKNPAAERRIWKFPQPYFDVMREAFNFRYSMLPYLYTAARQSFDTGVGMGRPLYYAWPQLDDAYAHGESYMLGDDLLVTPVTQPGSALAHTTAVHMWLPPGDWVRWSTGEELQGPREIDLLVPLEETPIFVRAGAIIPRRTPAQRIAKVGRALVLDVFPGAEGHTRVYDDDGESINYEDQGFTWTPVVHRAVGADHAARQIVIGPVEGAFRGSDGELGYEVHFRDVWPAEKVLVNGAEVGAQSAATPKGWSYDPATFTVVVPVQGAAKDRIEVEVRWAADRRDRRPLAAGLRGRLAAIDALHSRLGLKFDEPSAWADANPAGADKYVDERINALLKAADEGKLAPAARDALMSALLQLTFDVVARPASDGGIDLAATLGTAPLGPGVKVESAELQLMPSPHWNIQGQTNWMLPALEPLHPASIQAHLLPAGEPQTSVVGAMLKLTTSHGAQTVRLDQPLLPSIGRWWVLGPFDAPQKDRLQQPFPPEAKVDLAATYPGKGGKTIGWTRFERAMTPDANLADEFFVEFHKVFGEQVYDAVAYGLVFIDVPADTPAFLAIGSDDGFAAWLNGAEVGRHDVGRAYTAREDRVPIQLKKGANTLLVKVSQGGGMWGFGVHIEDEAGRPLTSARTRLAPQADLSAEPKGAATP
jgi:alpha-glucosidase